MLFFKVSNLQTKFGQSDYKGLDISQFISGSQCYAQDMSYCLIATNEIVTITNVDLVELTETDYDTQRQVIESAIIQIQQSADQKISDLQAQNAQMLLALVTGGLM